MSTLPDSRRARVEFFEQHAPVWAANAVQIGLLPAQTTQLTTLTTAARTALDAADAARNASKAATTTFYNNEDSLSEFGGDLIKTIRAFAETQNQPNVYAVAQIPPPAAPTPTPPPAQPDDLSGSLNPFGVITLKWKATPKGPSSGVFFFVERKVGSGPASAWAPIGATQAAEFLDSIGSSITSGGVIQYRVQARRGTDASPWSDPMSVDFTGGQDSIAGFIGGEGEAAEAA